MRDSLLAAVGLAAPWCPVLSTEQDPLQGWSQFGLLGLVLLTVFSLLKRFMESTMETQKAQVEVLKTISEEMRAQREATAALDIRITRHMDQDERQSQEMVRLLEEYRRTQQR